MTVKLERIWFYAGLTSLISVIGILIVFSGRGFDFTDEGLYALLSNPNQENRSSIINYDIIFKYLYQYFGITFNLIELRILRLILVLLGSFYLLTPIYQLNKERIKKVISPRLFVIIGLLLGFWSYAPWFIQTPNYNSFHFFGIQLFLGSLLFFHTSFISNRIIRTILFSSICFLGFIFCWLSKISGIPVLFFILILQYFIKSNKSFVWNVLFLLLFTIYFVAFFNSHTLMYKSILQNVMYALFQKLNSYSFNSQFKNITLNFILFVSSISFGYIFSKTNLPLRKINVYVIFILIIFSLFLIFVDFERSKANNLYVNEFSIRYFVHRISIATVIFLSFFTGLLLNKNKNNLLQLFILHLSIFSYVIGTSNNLLYQSIGSIQFLLIGWLFLNIGDFHKKIILSTIPVTIILFLSTIFFNVPKGQGRWISNDKKYYFGGNKYDFIYLKIESFFLQNKIKEALQKESINNVISYPHYLGLTYLSGYSFTSPGSYLWGNGDIDMYFRKKFTNPKSIQLILYGKKSQDIIFPYIKNYTITIKDSINTYFPERYKDSTKFYIYKCIRNN